MNLLEKWLYWKEHLIDCFENKERFELGFLRETVEVEPDGYGGIDKEFYFANGMFYSCLFHWDGGNFTANRSYEHTHLNKEAFFQILDEKKENILQTLSEDDKIKFESVFNDVRVLLLKQFKSDLHRSV